MIRGYVAPAFARPATTRWLVIVLVAGAALLAAPQAAMAWKPYAHNYIGDQAYNDAVGDGMVQVGTHSYPIDPRLRTALRGRRAFFNAGVVGPDGFPDLAYGQSQIHPEHTGKWLRYILDRAWGAQSDPQYTTAERGEILAFAYGFLTHAAGDMWGHTLINDFAGGLFPAFKDVIDPDTARNAATIALRHVVAEGYAGSATPGWDRSSNPSDRKRVCTSSTSPPATKCNDVSDDQTRGILFAAPHKFIYNTLINPRVPLPVGTCNDGVDDDHDGTADDGCPGEAYTVRGTPEPQRGPMLDYFLDRQASVKIEAARYSFNGTCTASMRDCTSKSAKLTVSTVRGNKGIVVFASRYDPVTASYLRAWVDDIDTGLRDWSRFSLSITKALFDPQARRDAQNDECASRGSETSLVRSTCESAVGALDTVVFKTEDYVDDHLLSMLGSPDAIGSIKKGLHAVSDWLDSVLGEALNPLRYVRDIIKKRVKDFVSEQVREATGIDPDEVRRFLARPARWMCGSSGVSIKLPSIPTKITGADLFTPDEHRRLDDLIGLPAGHHQAAQGSASEDCSPLTDSARYDPNRFAAIKDSITQAKLLMLGGTQLNRALGQTLVDAGIIKDAALVHTYQPNGNVMFSGLDTSVPWLELIDGDHAWRQDGRPRFCDGQASCPASPEEPRIKPRVATASTGGTGRYPLWESCVLRPAFRALFTDWENDANRTQKNFPDLGDATSPDRTTDPNPPTVSMRVSRGQTGTLVGMPVVIPGAAFVATAHDDVFTDAAIKLAYRTYVVGSPPGAFQDVANGGSFVLPPIALIGDWVVEVVATDPCGSQTVKQTVSIL